MDSAIWTYDKRTVAIFPQLGLWRQLNSGAPVKGTNFGQKGVKSGVVKLEAIVKLESGMAEFVIAPEGRGIYRADLVKYEGQPEFAPPQRIILTRGIRRWTGSCDREDLLGELGQMIDRLAAEAPIFKEERSGRNTSNSPDQRENR